MIYIYDILLNWTDPESIYNFYEWRTGDTIEHIKRMPLVKVTKQTLSDFLNNKVIIPSDFLNTIKEMTEVFRNKKVETVTYATCLSDGVKALAFEFNEGGELIYHSTMLLDEEEDIIDLVSKTEFMDINYKIKSPITNINNGLTRLEVDKKQFLIKELEQAHKTQNGTKLSYLYQEYFAASSDDSNYMYNKLIESFTPFSNNHEKLYQLLKLSMTKKQV
ncbi:MAG: DUF3603 family protein [Bacilli bacterium]